MKSSPYSKKHHQRLRLNKSRFFPAIGYLPHEGQWQVHNAKEEVRILACGARWGKTTLAAAESLAAAMEPNPKGTVGWVVGPSYDLSERCFSMIMRMASEHLADFIVRKSLRERVLILNNMAGAESEIRAKTADNEDSLLGEGLDWCVMDECSRMRSTVWTDYIQARLLDKLGWCLMISTPKGKGWYWEEFRRGQPGASKAKNVRSWHMPTWSNPHVPKWKIMERRGTIPERSWRQEYEAQFLEGEGEVFRNVRLCANAESLPAGKPGARYYAGLDLARVQDYTVLVVMDEDGNVVHHERWRRIDWDKQAQLVFNVLQRYNDANVLVDATGVGDPIAQQLANAGCFVRPFVFGQKSKAKLVDNLVVAFERQEIAIPPATVFPELIEELEAFEYSTTPGGAVKANAPRGSHDDCVIALALAAWGARRYLTKSQVATGLQPTPGVRIA